MSKSKCKYQPQKQCAQHRLAANSGFARGYVCFASNVTSLQGSRACAAAEAGR